MFIKKILQKNILPLFQIYAYLIAYQVLTLIGPYALGKAIDGLILHDWDWLIGFFAIEISANLFMYKRMVFDTIIYTRIYNEIVLQFLKNSEEDTSTKSARTDMANMIIHFFEDAIPYYLMSIITIIGSAAFICFDSLETGIVVISCSIPITYLVLKYYPKIDTVTKLGNSHYEKKVIALSSTNKDVHQQFFSRRGKLQIYRSTLLGKSWFSLNNTKVIFLIAALVFYVHSKDYLTQGEAIAMFSYINRFLDALMSIPVAMEIWSMVRDVTKRLNEE